MQNEAWLINCATLVFFMQAGFTALECGLVRRRNRGNVTLKNAIDFCVSGLLFFIIGYGIMFGSSLDGLMGTNSFFSIPNGKYAFFLFQLVFCSTAITIASGALAERMRFHSYVLLVMVIASLIYPIIGHWIWATDSHGASVGWLARLGFLDFAGSTVVHSVGAWAALAGVLILGPRTGRFDPKLKAKYEQYNTPLVGVGVFILWFGWIGFNGGSTLEFNSLSTKAIVNTVLAGITGGLGVLIYEILFKEKVNIIYILNGILAGLVSITANCAWVEPISTILIGAIGSGIAILGLNLLERKKIDDVVSAIPIHGFCGVWGTLCVALFADPDTFQGVTRLEQLGIQALGCLVTFVWSFGLTYVAVKSINAISPLRVTPEEEKLGLDNVEHGLTLVASKKVYDDPSGSLTQPDDDKPEQNVPSETKARGTQVLFERTVVTSVCVGILVFVGLVTISHRTLSKFVLLTTQSALETQASLIKDFRALYTRNVVNRLSGSVKVTHDFRNHSRAIPLPATMTKELGNKSGTTQTRLYSDYPFPWRKRSASLALKDPLRVKALNKIRNNPSKPIVEQLTIEGKKFLRYSIADTMQEASCVNCHNSHPQSPKRDWKLGDVRGILEVQIPYEAQLATIKAETKEPLIAIIALLILASTVFFMVLRRFKKISVSSQESLLSVEESKEKIRAISQASNDAIISVDSHGIIMFCNPASAKLTGHTMDELIGSPIVKWIPEKYRNSHEKAFQVAVERGHTQLQGSLELPILTKDGEQTLTEISLSSWRYKNEIHFTAIVRDITEKKEQELKIEAQNAQLVQSEKLSSIGELAAGVGHEINNPLAIVQGYVTRIKGQLDKKGLVGEVEQKHFEAIDKSIERISKIVNGLRTYARSNTKHVEVLNCHDRIRDTTQLVESIYVKEGIIFEHVLEAQNTNIEGNIGQFQQVIMNLITNAKDATAGRDKRNIKISTKNTADSKIEISVYDNGSGIKAEVIPKIFDTFFTTKGVGKGTGMGLGLSKKFIEQMGGSIHVDSAFGSGTTFKLEIPLTEKKVKKDGKSKSTDSSIENLTGHVLIVDDESDIRELIADCLEDTKLKLEFASDGVEALALLKAKQYDFLITDIQMPRMCGDELLREVAKLNRKEMRSIIVTGGVTTKMSEKAGTDLRALADAYVLKPFTPESIIKALTDDKSNKEAA